MYIRPLGKPAERNSGGKKNPEKLRYGWQCVPTGFNRLMFMQIGNIHSMVLVGILESAELKPRI